MTKSNPKVTLEAVVSRHQDLPTMLLTALEVVREASLDSATTQTVGDRLARDVALTARVLRLANSPYYGLARKVVQPQEAVRVLGMRAIRNLCLVASTYAWMSSTLPGYSDDPKSLWQHSFATAIAAKVLAEGTGVVSADEAFSAGLLHHIGRIALGSMQEGKAARPVIGLGDEMPFDEFERRELGFDHAEAGFALARAWNLPNVLGEAIRYHHRPSVPEQPVPLADVVHVADALCRMLGLGLCTEGLRYELDEAAVSRLSISAEDFSAYCLKTLGEYEREELLFDVSEAKAA
jgi:putative nucleotidyltransferase with HDIG domain